MYTTEHINFAIPASALFMPAIELITTFGKYDNLHVKMGQKLHDYFHYVHPNHFSPH